jgi:hypothetical protein
LLEEEIMIIFLNNCHGDDYAGIYGSGAFYDLNTYGIQATKATNISVGQQCIVAAPARDDQIIFRWFSFLNETVKPDKSGKPCRVFFGKFIKSDTLLKRDAARDALYSAFFDKNGHFKRQSVIQR